MNPHYEIFHSHVENILQNSNRPFRIVEPNCHSTQLIAEHIMMRALLMCPMATIRWMREQHPNQDVESNDSLIHGVFDHPDFHGYCNRHTHYEE